MKKKNDFAKRMFIIRI